MGTFNFKSVGKTKEQQLIEALTATSIPIGIKTPLRLGEQDGIFAMHFSLPDQIHNNLKDLLLTNWGERLGLYNFGANLRELTTNYINQDDFDAEAVKRINSAVTKWMPFVSLEDFLSETKLTQNVSTVNLTITYTIPALQSGRRALQVVMYVL